MLLADSAMLTLVGVNSIKHGWGALELTTVTLEVLANFLVRLRGLFHGVDVVTHCSLPEE